MDIVNEIRQIISKALKKFSKEKSIKLHDLRIKISKNAGSELKYEILNGRESVSDVELHKVLGLNNIAGMVIDPFGKQKATTDFLNNLINSIAQQDDLPISEINIRIYTRGVETAPNYHLFKNNNAVKNLELSTFIN